MIIDFHLDFLRAAVTLVDASLARLHNDAQSSPDPDTFGIFDELEYITGFGFVACQTYATAVVSRSQLRNKKREAASAGAKASDGPIHGSTG
jgi:hypothetical protein